ncbi:MAG: hypothetical protein U9N49_09895 [Campylobacterota bacterium]|nr:hypothetical protein [Campylobacterota bacterium]
MCILQIVGILALLILIRYLWWSSTQGNENPYMKMGEALNPMPLTSSDAKGESKEARKATPESPKEEKEDDEEAVKEIERIKVNTDHKELVKVEEESSLEDVQTPAVDEAKPSLMEQPLGEKDDLKKISGIGPKIEEKLNNLGIFHYQQIAEFTEKNIQWVDENLSFKGRAMRDDWIGQAKVLAKGEETEFSKRYK